jgi:hypothetical protein
MQKLNRQFPAARQLLLGKVSRPGLATVAEINNGLLIDPESHKQWSSLEKRTCSW